MHDDQQKKWSLWEAIVRWHRGDYSQDDSAHHECEYDEIDLEHYTEGQGDA